MTKGIPPRHSLFKRRDGNQEDAHAPEFSSRSLKIHIPLQQQQSPDQNEQGAETRDSCKPTPLEALLDLELDLVLPAAATPAAMSNQLAASTATDKELATNIDSVSLEFLALQSPHGENQQWQSEEQEQDVDSIPNTAPNQPEHSPRRKTEEASAPRKPMRLNIVSPTAFVPSFPPSFAHPSADDDYGLASPMALPDSPSQARAKLTLAWNLEPSSPTLEDADTRDTFHRLAQSKSVQRPKRRTSSFSPAVKAATPNPKGFVPERAASRITRSSLPTLPEVRGKARHGGIYSLLLKNKSAKQEPVLVEDAHTPEEVTAPSVSKVSPPRTFNKQKHGGIYKMLRAGNEPRCTK